MWLLLICILGVSGLRIFNPDITRWNHGVVFCQVPACVLDQEWYLPQTLVLANSVNLPRHEVLFQISPPIEQTMSNFTAKITYRGSPEDNPFTVDIVVNGTRRGHVVLSSLSESNQTITTRLHGNFPVGAANVSFVVSTRQSTGIPAYLNIIEINLYYEQDAETSAGALIGFILGGFLLLTWLLYTVYVTVRYRC